MTLANSKKANGIMTVIGGLLLNFISGNIMNCGALLPYAASYLSSTDSGANSSLVYDAQSFSLISEILGTAVAPILSRKLGVRLCLLLGGSLVSAAYLLCSATSDPYLFVFGYSGLLGVGAGIISITSLQPGWEYFPESKGKITGIIMAGYSTACMIFGLIFTYIANPYNVSPVRSGNNIFFGHEVDVNVPSAFFWIGCIFLALALFAFALIRPIRSKMRINSTPGLPVKELLKMSNVWNMFFFVSASLVFWYFITAYYKSFGILYIQDDHFLAYLGSVANVVGVLGRCFWPTLLDYFPFKTVMTLCMSFEILASILIWYAVGAKTSYAVLIISVFFVGSAHYPCIAAQTGKVFEELSSQVWPFVYSGVGIASVSVILIKFMADSVGYFQACIAQAFVLVLSILFSWGVQESYKPGESPAEFIEPLI